MAKAKAVEINAIVRRCRRVGWPVEKSTGREDWVYRILMPNGGRVQLHQSPSDNKWQDAVLGQLAAGGFVEAEEAQSRKEEIERKAKIQADRQRAEAKAVAVAKRAKAHDEALARAAGPLAVTPVDINWLLTPADVPQTRTVLLTPEAAQKALDTINTENRKKRDHRTADFVTIIRDGEWGVTHQGAAVDSNGVLQDGQHRFQAIVEVGVALPMQVSIGMPPENFRKVDTPLMRTARDAAYMRGERNINMLVASARLILHVDAFGPEAHRRKLQRLSIDRVDRATMDMGEGLRDAVKRADRIRKEIKINAAALATAIYLITRKMRPDDPRVVQFLDQIETGIGVSKSHPIWLLRRMFIRARDIRGGAIPALEALAYLMKAWNHTARGTNLVTLIWRANEPFPSEPFLPPPLDAETGPDELDGPTP